MALRICRIGFQRLSLQFPARLRNYWRPPCFVDRLERLDVRLRRGRLAARRRPPTGMKPFGVNAVLCLVLAVFSMAVLSRGQKYSGVSFDEAKLVGISAQVLAGKNLSDAGPSSDCDVSVRGIRIPLFQVFYRGPWEIYAAVPFVAFVKDPAEALKIYSLFFAVVCVVLTFLVGVVFTADAPVAFLGAVAMATSDFLMIRVPTGYCRSGTTDASICLAALLCLGISGRDKSGAPWYLACFLAGFAPGVAPQAAAFFVAWCLWIAARRDLPASRGASLLAVSTGLFLSMAPMILANALFDWPTLREISAHLHRTSHGVDNTEYLLHLRSRASDLYAVWGGRRGLGVAAPALLGTSLLFCVWALVRGGRGESAARSQHLLPVFFMAVIFFISPFTLFSLGSQHLFLLLPLGLLTMMNLPRQFRDPQARVLRGTVIAGLFLWLWGNAVITRKRLSSLRMNGGYKAWTTHPLVSQLAGWLADAHPTGIYLMTSGRLEVPILRYLTYGRVAEIEKLVGMSDADRRGVEARIEALVGSDSAGSFVAEGGEALRSESLEFLEKTCRRYGRSLEPVKTFAQADGTVVFIVYAIRPRA